MKNHFKIIEKERNGGRISHFIINRSHIIYKAWEIRGMHASPPLFQAIIRMDLEERFQSLIVAGTDKDEKHLNKTPLQQAQI